MKSPIHDWAEIRSDAERRFLGRSQVVGIAIRQQPIPQLVFFLEQTSPQAEAEIRHWAFQRGVEVQLDVTGLFRKLTG